MYKTRNTGTRNGTRGVGGILYSGECRQTFHGMSSNIPGMSQKNPGNIIKNSGERRQRFQGMLPIFGVKGRVTI